MEVLRLENIERRVLDQNILLNVLRLGRDASLGLEEAKRVLNNESLPLSSRTEHDLLPLLYRTAMSTTSDSASDYTSGSSRATSLNTAPSIISTNSSRSLLLKLRKGYKRLSHPSRRRIPDDGPQTTLSQPNPSLETIDDGPDSRPSSAHSVAFPITAPFQPLRSISLPPPLISDFPIYSLGRFSCAFESYSTSNVDDDDSLELAAAKERSLLNSYLRSERAKALEQQSHFLQQCHRRHQDLVRQKEAARKTIISSYADRELSLKAFHVTAFSELESKHLNAEQELESDLATEQRNLDIRIKHMTGYCSGHGSPSPEGTLKRKVTASDRMSLEQQQHVGKGMDNLHKAKINVLRAKQVKQIERLMEKQKQELEDLHMEQENALSEDEEKFREREGELKHDMTVSKQRMSRQWNFEEAFARWRLEEETGLKHGPLSAIEWSEDDEELGSWKGVSVFNDDEDNDEVIRMSIDATDSEVEKNSSTRGSF